MRRRQEYSQREKSVLHIEGNESSYLVLKEVPKEKAWNGSMNSLVETEAQMALYTPPQEEETNTLGNHQELLWGTPNTLDHLDQRSDEALKRLARVGGRKRRSHPGNLREQVNPHAIEIYQDLLKETQEKEASIPIYERKTSTAKSPQEQTQEKYKLNPRWVETLMGLPMGWVMPSCTSPLTIERMKKVIAKRLIQKSAGDRSIRRIKGPRSQKI